MGNPSVAIGLDGITDWTTSQPFLDIFKTSRPWTGHLPGQFGGMDAAELRAGGWLDEDGWLTGVPETLTGVSAIILTELPAGMTSMAGRYRLTYDGVGEIRLNGAASNVVAGDGEIWFDYVPDGASMVLIDILASDPGRTGDYLRNISVVQETHIAAHEAGEIFNPDFVGLIDDFRALRFMDWMRTNDSTVSAWEERATRTSATWAGDAGVPLEVMLELANRTGTDPWFNIPHLADEAYVRAFAEAVKAGLAPGLKAHVEYSNEVWNWGFDQAQWAFQEGRERWGEDVGDAWVQFYGMKAAEMADTFREVFGSEAEARLDLVIAPQTGWRELAGSVLDAPESQADGNAAPYLSFDSLAITGYFDGGLGRDEKAPEVKRWIRQSQVAATAEAEALGLAGDEKTAYVAAHRYDLATERAISELRDGGVTGDPRGSLAELFSEYFVYWKGVADSRGLALTMYEGGTHVVGVGRWSGDGQLADFFTTLNYSEEMGQLYAELLRGWKDAGGGMFNAFVAIAGESRWGSWGALRHLDDHTARWDALTGFDADVAAWYDPRPSDTFDGENFARVWIGSSGAERATGYSHDDLMRGVAGGDTLAGARGADRLEGGAGNDQLDGGSGADTLSGGTGTDAISAGGGDDFGIGGDGGDGILGGEGDDTLLGGDGRDRIEAGAGDDRAFGGTGNDGLRGGSGDDHLRGDTGADRIDGEDGGDTLLGGENRDTVRGGAGADRIEGGAEDDWLDGGTGHDALAGGDGADRVFGDDGNDALDAGDGDDLARGGAGNDQLIGGDGDDTLDGGFGTDAMLGGYGRDLLLGGTANDRLLGGGGSDRLDGGAGNDSLAGGTGADTLTGGGGADRLAGGYGRDVFVFHEASDSRGTRRDTIEGFEAGRDQVDFRPLEMARGHFTGAHFSGHAGDARMAGGLVALDIDGDGVADLTIALVGVAGVITGHDFLF